MVHRLHQVLVSQGIAVARGVRQTSEFKSFLAVRSDERQIAEVEMMHRLGIEAQPDAVLVAESLYLVEQRLGDDALAIITHNHGRSAAKFLFKCRDQLPGRAII